MADFVPPDSPEPTAVPDGFEPPPRKGRSGVVIGILATILAVLAGAVVYAATQLSGGGRQPDELAPLTTYAFAKVDFDPAAGQKLAARDYLHRVRQVGNTDQLLDDMLSWALGGNDLTYVKDVKPWFDRRAAIAVFPGAGAHPEVVGILRSKDDAKAKATLDRAATAAKAQDNTLAYQITHGYVVLGTTAQAVDDAVRGSAARSIHDNATYRADVAQLTGDQVVTMWADVPGLLGGIASQLPQLGALSGLATAGAKGRVVAGVHLTSTYLEAEGYALGGAAPAGPATKPVILTDLPADTVAAASIAGLGTSLGPALATLGGLGIDLTGGTGLDIRALLPLIGNQTVIALGSASFDPSTIEAAVISKPTGEITTQGKNLAAGLTQLLGIPVRHTEHGGLSYLTVGAGYAERLAGEHGLGSAALFRTAMGELGDSVAVALYVDLHAVTAGRMSSTDPRLGAAGLSIGTQGGRSYFRLRLVAG